MRNRPAKQGSSATEVEPPPGNDRHRAAPVAAMALVEQAPTIGRPTRRRAVPAAPRTGVPAAMVRATRPEQWIKNLLVFLAPVVSMTALPLGALARASVAFVAFTAAAGATYVVNDLVDRDADRRHPWKRHRPIASGAVVPRAAVALAVSLGVTAVVLPMVIGSAGLAITVVGYLVLSALYNGGGKHLPHVEFVAIVAFYLLRAVGGAWAAGVALPVPLAVVLGATAAHLVAGKRYAELRELGVDGGTRRVLRHYSVRGLAALRSATSLVAFAFYGWWVAGASQATGVPWFALSIVPAGVGFLRYTAVVEDGKGQRPERLVWADRPLFGSILCTGAALGLGALGA